VPNIESQLETLSKWQHDRDSLIARAVLGIAASLLIGLFATLVAGDLALTTWTAVVATLGLIATTVFGIFRLLLMRRTDRAYLAALRAVADLREIRPFLELVRRVERSSQ
jgi:hypothetical protein